MAFPPLALPNFVDRVVSLGFAAVKKTVDEIVAKRHLDSLVIEGITLKTGSRQAVPHGLGRRLVGWKVTRKSAAADIYDEQSLGAAPDRFLYLRSSALVVVSLEVF